MSGVAIQPPERALRWGLHGLALLFVALAVVGAVRAYSPVPFSDMWSAYVPFLDQAANGDWTVWWQQHNEHRVVLARLFFWIDLRWFHGAGWFLIVVNYLLLALAALLACRILRQVAVPPGRELDMKALAALAVAWLFFWSQWENLTWGFQNQFLLAQLLPLAALYALYRSLHGADGLFALACLLGILSIGTMANGILALPLMTVYAALTRQGARRIGILAALSALLLSAYFHGYASVAAHGSLLQELREQPLRVVRFVLLYLGNPFHFVFGEATFGRTMAQVAGLCFVAATLRMAWQLRRQPGQAALPLAMLCYIAYIAGTALGTAGGRLVFGLAQGLSSRYSTPALMAWFALMVLYAPALLALQGRRRRQAWGGVAVLALLMLAYQLHALNSRAGDLFERAVAALAIELRIKDKAEIAQVYPSTDAIALSLPASERQRSVFGLYPYQGARLRMETVFAPLPLPACQGVLEAAASIDDDRRFLRIGGWLWSPAGKTVPQVVRVLDADGRQVGYALGGQARADVGQQVGAGARWSGFRGYLSSAPMGTSVTLRAEGPAGPFCQLQANVPQQAGQDIALKSNQ